MRLAASLTNSLRCVLPRSLTGVCEFRRSLGPVAVSPDLGGRATFIPARAPRVGVLYPFVSAADYARDRINFDTSRKPGSDPRRVGANAFHGNNHGASNVQGLGKGFQGG